MLELYGWESVFYISGILAVLWAYCMWKFMLKGEGSGGSASRKTRAIDLTRGTGPGFRVPPKHLLRISSFLVSHRWHQQEMLDSCAVNKPVSRRAELQLPTPEHRPAFGMRKQNVFNTCLQGRSSRWSRWEAEDPSPNCPKGTGYVSSSSRLSGEVTVKKVPDGNVGLSVRVIRLEVTAFLTVHQQRPHLEFGVFTRSFYYHGDAS